MNIQPSIINLAPKKLIGQKRTMSLSNNKTFELWRTFMPRHKEILNTVGSDKFSLQVYDTPINSGDLDQLFDKWALVEVVDFDTIPEGMQAFTLEGGLYAVFDYKGLNTDSRIFAYVFRDWLPKSKYEVDSRPHFEVLGSKYKNGDPNSEEEIWIPIKKKIKKAP